MPTPNATPQPNVMAEAGMAGLSMRFWMLVLPTGVGTGLAAAALMGILHAVQHLFWHYRWGGFLAGVEQTSAIWRVSVLAAAGLLAFVALALIRRAFKGQSKRLPEAIWFHSGKVETLHMTITAVLSIVLVGMGASLGREGAPKEVGAAIAGKLAEWTKLSPAEWRLLVACGAGAGMGAVYNVPLGGALFGMEVLLGTLALPVLIPAITTSLIATAVSWVTLPVKSTYAVPDYHFSGSQLMWALVFGPIAGFATLLYIKAIAAASTKKPKGIHSFVMCMLVFTGLGCAAIAYPQLLGNGKPVVQLAFSGSAATRMSLMLLVSLVVLKPIATSLCLSTGSPGGLFTPTVTFGAMLGGALGWCWIRICPGAPLGGFAVIGAGAVLAAASQGPISAIVLLLELTHSVDPIMVPLMLAVAGASFVARAFDARSIYSARIAPIAKQSTDAPKHVETRFSQKLIEDGYGMIDSSDSYARVTQRFLNLAGPHRTLYVKDEHGKCVGRITRASVSGPEHAKPPLPTLTASDIKRPCETIAADASTEELEKRLAAADVEDLPVVDDEGKLIGVVLKDGGRHVAEGLR